MKRYLGFLMLVSGALLWQSCRREPVNHLNNEESRIYITQFDSTVNFANYTTFSVSDSVMLLVNGHNAGMVLDSADSLFIQAFRTDMEQAGYILVSKSDSPDLAVNITHLSSNYVGVTYFTSYGDYWNPYYWGYEGYSYGFPYYYSAYQADEDAVAFDMFDLRNATANGKQLKDVWSALIKGQDIFNPANVSAEVGILFSQSTYLKQ